MESYDILVIILSVAFGISVIVWIVIGVLFIQILKKVRQASDTAQEAANNFVEFTSSLKNVGKASAVGSFIKQVTKAFNKKNKD